MMVFISYACTWFGCVWDDCGNCGFQFFIFFGGFCVGGL